MTSAVQATPAADHTELRHVLRAGAQLGVLQSVLIGAFGLIQPRVDGAIELVVCGAILVIGIAATIALPGIWTRARTIEGISAAAGIGLWPRVSPPPAKEHESTAMPEILDLLVRFGYPPPHSYPDVAGNPVEVTAEDIVATFQRRFRPWQVDGRADADTMARLRDLLAQAGARR